MKQSPPKADRLPGQTTSASCPPAPVAARQALPDARLAGNRQPVASYGMIIQ